MNIFYQSNEDCPVVKRSKRKSKLRLSRGRQSSRSFRQDFISAQKHGKPLRNYNFSLVIGKAALPKDAWKLCGFFIYFSVF